MGQTPRWALSGCHINYCRSLSDFATNSHLRVRPTCSSCLSNQNLTHVEATHVEVWLFFFPLALHCRVYMNLPVGMFLVPAVRHSSYCGAAFVVVGGHGCVSSTRACYQCRVCCIPLWVTCAESALGEWPLLPLLVLRISPEKELKCFCCRGSAVLKHQLWEVTFSN